MNPSLRLAATVTEELVRCGVREVVLCPGSRNAPFAYCFEAADRAGRLRLHVRVDERSAAFLALGLAKTSLEPVAVCCTSGTAAANFHPAVLEASESGVPVVVLTADRPSELRGVGANQTVDQVRLYGGAVRHQDDLDPAVRPGDEAYWRTVVDRAVAAARGALTGDPGPVHLNAPLREPLAPDGDVPAPRPGPPHTTVAARREEPPPLGAAPERTVVVVGDAPPALGAKARALAEAHGWPVLAEPSSGARGGSNAITTYGWLLRPEVPTDALAPEMVLVVGRPTLSREVAGLLRSAPQVEVRSAGPRWADPGRVATRVALGVPEPGSPAGAGAWLEAWLAAEAAARRVLDSALDAGPLVGLRLARDMLGAVPEGAGVVLGSSLAVRDADLAAGDLTRLRVSANRGVAGIDGTVSTAAGAALASGRPGYALVGDLTFLHDANGLFVAPGEPQVDLTVVVADNGGGAIFGLLEHASADPLARRRVLQTPVPVDLEALCRAAGAAYARVADPASLPGAVAAGGGRRVVHVPVPVPAADERQALARAVGHAVAPLLR